MERIPVEISARGFPFSFPDEGNKPNTYSTWSDAGRSTPSILVNSLPINNLYG
jgi:hypothetical protein